MRKEKRRMGIQLLAGVLALAALAACLLLPQTLLRAGARQRFGTVQEADTAYYSREMASYTGELDLYRKLLLFTGVWESEMILEAAGTLPMLTAEAEEALSGPDEPAEWQQQLLAMCGQGLSWGKDWVELLRRDASGTNRYWSAHCSAPPVLKVYQCRDTKLDKYRFWLAEITAWSDEGQEEENFQFILLDMESMEALALRERIYEEREIYFPEPSTGAFGYFGREWFRDNQELERADFLPVPELLQAQEIRRVYGQWVRKQEDTEEEVWLVEQVDEKGRLYFLAIPPEQDDTGA